MVWREALISLPINPIMLELFSWRTKLHAKREKKIWKWKSIHWVEQTCSSFCYDLLCSRFTVVCTEALSRNEFSGNLMEKLFHKLSRRKVKCGESEMEFYWKLKVFHKISKKIQNLSRFRWKLLAEILHPIIALNKSAVSYVLKRFNALKLAQFLSLPLSHPSSRHRNRFSQRKK